MEGATLVLGALMPSVLVKHSHFRAALEKLGRELLLPLFSSPHAFVRAKAAWLAGQYAQELEFAPAGGDGPKAKGEGPLFDELFDHVLRLMADRCSDLMPPDVCGVPIYVGGQAASGRQHRDIGGGRPL